MGFISSFCRLSKANLEIRFVTNTTKESKRALYTRLQSIGFSASHEQIFTCLTAARNLIERDDLAPHLVLEDDAMEDFDGIESRENEPNAVVVGLAPSRFNYEHLNKAFR